MTDASSVSFGGETVKGATAKFVMALTGFFGTVIFARLLGPENFGSFYILFAIVKVADRPIGGTAAAAKKRFSESTASQSEVFGAQLVVIAMWLGLASSVSLLASAQLKSYTNLQAAPVLFVVLLTTEALFEPFERLLQAQGRVGLASWLDTARSYLTLPLQLGFVLAGLGAAGMAYGLAAATVVVLPFALHYLRVLPTKPSRETFKNMWSFARYSIPTAIIGKAYSSFDLLLLGALVGPVASGHYEVATKLSLPATFIAISAGSGLMARVSNLQSKGEDIAEDITNALSFSSILALPILFGALAIPEELVVIIFGSEYRPAAVLLVGLALYRLLRSQTVPLARAIDGIDKPQINRNTSVITLIVNIILGVFFIYQFGVVGVMIATIIAEALRYVIIAYKLHEEVSEIRLISPVLAQQLIAAIVMFIAIIHLTRFLSIQSWPRLTVLIGVGAVIYGSVLLSLSEQFRITVGSILRGSRIERYVPLSILRW